MTTPSSSGLGHQVLILETGIRIPVGSPFDKLRVLLHNKKMPWFVYILLCDNKTYYIGISHDLQKRVKSHEMRQNIATKEFSDLKLLYSEQYDLRLEAEKREKQLKGWTVAKKKALIEGNKDLLIKLSKTRSLLEDYSS
jgi:putative endonuclease